PLKGINLYSLHRATTLYSFSEPRLSFLARQSEEDIRGFCFSGSDNLSLSTHSLPPYGVAHQKFFN
ncbi:hypothetical protein, partial [Rahnella aceris]|uniref:hypothetical protein n=1 Tax=Rahnella sp. (strain Y9602) TaxID=2703885 RepID=UPI00364CD4B9